MWPSAITKSQELQSLTFKSNTLCTMWCYSDSCASHINDDDMIHFILMWCSFVLNISLSENNFDAVSVSKKRLLMRNKTKLFSLILSHIIGANCKFALASAYWLCCEFNIGLNSPTAVCDLECHKRLCLVKLMVKLCCIKTYKRNTLKVFWKNW